MAAAVLANRASEVDSPRIIVTSSGTSSWHVGEDAHDLSKKTWTLAGYTHSHSARQFTSESFDEVDLILAMDWENLSAMQQQCPKLHQHKLMLLMRFANEFEEATVPDPYYGGPEGFGKVLDYLEDSCQGVLELVRKRATQYQAA